jgi:hypothetical protein
MPATGQLTSHGDGQDTHQAMLNGSKLRQQQIQSNLDLAVKPVSANVG